MAQSIMVAQTAPQGLLSHATKVNQWECDHNGHWNVRYYIRAFQAASEYLALAATGRNPGAATLTTRHHRFHHELFAGAGVTLRSGRMDSPQGPVVAHFLSGARGLSATAIESFERPLPALPDLLPEAGACPRGLPAAPVSPLKTGEAVLLGPVLAQMCDHTDDLLTDSMMEQAGIATRLMLAQYGMTADRTRETRISRMAVEMVLTRHAPCPVGEVLEMRSGLTDLTRNSMAMQHDLCIKGVPVRSVLQRLIFVNLETRRVTDVPADLRPVLEAALGQGFVPEAGQ